MSAKVVCSCGWTKTYPTVPRAEANARRHVCTAGQKKRARRADRHHRCARCGLEQTYADATAAEARHWFGKHSCQKREQAMLRSALHADRMALVDRTPKPCLHKVANHQHGSRACYVLDTCRCDPCSKANSEAETQRERMKAYGRYHKYVNAEHVRAHLAELKAYGIGLKRVSALSGVSNGSLTKIWYGTYASTEGPARGRYGAGDLVRGPTRRVLRSTAERIYEIEAVPANLAPGMPDRERTHLAQIHLRALVALGWSQSKLGRRLDILPSNLGPMIGGQRTLTRGTVDKVEALFAELCMTRPPESTHRDKISASRARRYAREHGWLPPLALDDLGLDETPAEDDVDEAVVLRLLAGERVPSTPAEKAEALRRWRAAGGSEKAFCATHGWKAGRYVTREAGAA